MNRYKRKSCEAFTIIELIVVIVVIAIIATIVIISYQSVVDNAVKVSLVSDLVNASDQIKIYQSDNGKLPTSIGCPSSAVSGRLCVNVTSGNEFVDYHYDNTSRPKTFQLSARNGDDYRYRIASDSNAPLPCPAGFVIVPGSVTFGTKDFCVMKYEAKQGDGDKAVSVSSGTPWTGVSQYDAIGFSKKVEYCNDCHLITEAEWMTIAQNLLKVKTNWSGGDVGVGYIYNGHNDKSPNNILAASSDDGDAYFGTGNFTGDTSQNETLITGDHEKRVLTLSNGEALWDISGNVSEWTDAQISGTQPGAGDGGMNWRELNDLSDKGSLLVNIFPDNLGIAGADAWDHYNGIGLIKSGNNDSNVKGFARGGDFDDGGYDGVLSLRLDYDPNTTSQSVGFRVSR